MLNVEKSSNIFPIARWTISLPPCPTLARAHVTLETAAVNWRNNWMTRRGPRSQYRHSPAGRVKPSNARATTKS